MAGPMHWRSDFEISWQYGDVHGAMDPRGLKSFSVWGPAENWAFLQMFWLWWLLHILLYYIFVAIIIAICYNIYINII